MRAFDEDNKLVEGFETKEGESLDDFFNQCQKVFEKEEVARMEIFKQRFAEDTVRKDAQLQSAIEQKLEEIEKHTEKFQPKPFYRRNERY